MVLIFAGKNKNHGSCYKQEWELIGSYFGFFPAYFSFFSLISAFFGFFQLILVYLELMVLIFTLVLISTPKLISNKNHQFFRVFDSYIFQNLRVFSSRTMVLIQKMSVILNQPFVLSFQVLSQVFSKFLSGCVIL